MTTPRTAVLALSLLALAAAVPAEAQVPRDETVRRGGPGTGNPDEHRVPWRFAEKGSPLATSAIITLYWLPASNDEAQRSPLLASRSLIEADLRCVALFVVLPEDSVALERLGATGKVPAAVLVNAQGAVLRRADNIRGVLKPAAVEQIVSDELSARDDAMFHDMAEARRRAAAGEKEAAIRIYQKIWDDRCLYPLAGTEAQRGLKGLGVIVVEVPKPLAVDPGLHPPTPAPGTPNRKPDGDKKPDRHG